EAQAVAKSIESLTTTVNDKDTQIKNLKQQIDELSAAAEVPDIKTRSDAEAEAKRLEDVYNNAVSNAAKLAADLKVLQDNPNALLPGDAATQPVLPPPPPAPDAQLTKLQTELDQLTQKVGLAKEGQSDRAKIARAQLDAALDSFNQQIAQ